MDVLAFAAARSKRLTSADDELRPFVARALANMTFTELIDAASVLWLEIFEAEAPNADSDRIMQRFRTLLTDHLDKTSKPTDTTMEASVNRLTYWLGTFTVNDATFRGNTARGGERMRWHTMEDEAVRGTHRAANGQIASVDGTFDIGGHDLHYPGEPVGPPEIWINCRCLLAPDRLEGFDVATITAALPKPEDEDREVEIVDPEPEVAPDELPPVDEEVVDDPEDDDEELITEIPVHGVIAPEGVDSGDGRLFDAESMLTRDLPLPLRYEYVSSHGGDTSMVATIGRVDKFWREGNLVRFEGVIIVTKEWSMKVIEGIVDGSIRGVSIDGDLAVQREITEEEFSRQVREAYTQVRLAGLTVVPIPAFQETFLALGETPSEENVEAMAAALLASCDCVSTIEEAREEIVARLAGHPEDDDNPDIEVGYDAFRDFPADERKKSADKGHAMPDGSFPIENVDDLKNAIQAIGRAKDPDAAKRHIKKRARELGQEALIPDTWAAEELIDALAEEGIEVLVAAPGTKDGPGWITHPIPTSRIRHYWVSGQGAAKIRWGVPGDFNRCRKQLVKYVQNPDWLAGLCANMHKEALKVWPGQEGGGRGHAHSLNASAAPAMNLVASLGTIKPAAFFKNPNLPGPTPLTITDDGHIFGHLATWGVCHVGFTDSCVKAPESLTNYANFRTGGVMTEEGRIAVGQITMGTGHAPITAGSRAAVAHYDNTGTCAADVAVGDDAHGIWFSGMVRAKLTPDQIDELRAAALSGDWRNRELVAALAVPVPGFPIPQSLAASMIQHMEDASTGEEALVAAGMVSPTTETSTAGILLSAEELAGMVRASVREMRHQEQRDKRLEPFKEKVNAYAAKVDEERRGSVVRYFGYAVKGN